LTAHLQQVNRSQLRQMAIAEAANGVIGMATAQLAQLEARERAAAANIRHINNQGQGRAMKKGPLLPVQNPGMN
jgi:hypothetical protein